MLQGTAVMDSGRRQETALAGQMLVYGSWHPYVSRTFAANGTVRCLLLSAPVQSLAVPSQWAHQLPGYRLPATGASAVLANLLKETFETAAGGTELRPQESIQLGNAALSLISAIIASHAGAQSAVTPESRHQAALEHIHAFIDAHLADPALDPQSVADAHHISLRQLHRLFHQNGASVSAWIRLRRLERSRGDLADATLVARPIHAIALRHGFPSAAEFSRAFRTAYGMTPSDYRSSAVTA